MNDKLNNHKHNVKMIMSQEPLWFRIITSYWMHSLLVIVGLCLMLPYVWDTYINNRRPINNVLPLIGGGSFITGLFLAWNNFNTWTLPLRKHKRSLVRNNLP